LATYFVSLNHPQANLQKTVLVHSASAFNMGFHSVYKLFYY